MNDEIKFTQVGHDEFEVIAQSPEAGDTDVTPKPRKRKATKAMLPARIIYYTHTYLHRSPLRWYKHIATFLDGIDEDAIAILLERGDISILSVATSELTALKSYGTILETNGYTSVAAILDANTDDLAKILTMRMSDVFELQDRIWLELGAIARA